MSAFSELVETFKTFKHYHYVVFIITYFGNVFIHASRKSLSGVKPLIAQQWTPSKHNETIKMKLPNDIWNSHKFLPVDPSTGECSQCEDFLGGLDTAFMLSYAIGMFISGPIGDRYNPRYVITFGLLGMFATVFLFANVGEWFHLYSYFWYIPIWILNGLFNSAGLPNLVSIMGNWFGKRSRGFIFGLWGTNASVGNIIGSLIVGAVLTYGYNVAMLITALPLLVIASFTFFGVVNKPEDVGLPSPKDYEQTEAEDCVAIIDSSELEPTGGTEINQHADSISSIDQIGNGKKPPIGIIEAIMLPGVIIVSVFLCDLLTF